MRRTAIVACCLVLCAAAPASAQAIPFEPSLSAAPIVSGPRKTEPTPKRRVRRVIVRRYPASKWTGLSWDLQVEFGYAFSGIDQTSRRFFGRTRAGVLWVNEPWYIALGATLEGPGVPQLAGGIQAEVTHLYWGLWGQVGVSIGAASRMFFHAAAGWSLFGFEWQRQIRGDVDPMAAPRSAADLNNDGVKNAFLVKLRGPIGILFFGKVLN